MSAGRILRFLIWDTVCTWRNLHTDSAPLVPSLFWLSWPHNVSIPFRGDTRGNSPSGVPLWQGALGSDGILGSLASCGLDVLDRELALGCLQACVLFHLRSKWYKGEEDIAGDGMLVLKDIQGDIMVLSACLFSIPQNDSGEAPLGGPISTFVLHSAGSVKNKVAIISDLLHEELVDLAF